MARIAVVLPSAGLGGAERQAWLAAGRLRQHGHTAAVFAMAGGGGLAERCATAGLACSILPRVESRSRLLAGWKLRRAAEPIRAWRPDALLPFCSAPNVLCGCIAAAGGPPSAWNQRDEGLFPQHPAHEARALRSAAIATANGPGGLAWLAAHGRDDARLIGNAVVPDPPLLGRAAWRERLGVPPDATLAAMLATLSPAKDHAGLLRAWAAVERSLPAAWLVLAGADGGEEPRLRTLAAGLHLERVAWAGPVADASGLLAAADLGVLVSRSEGLSNAVLEYRSAGLAVVGSDVAGIRAAAGSGARLVAPGDDGGLAAALLEAIGDAGHRQALAARARDGLPGAGALDAWIPLIEDLLGSRPA